ncbi:hypothetical protein [Empedobacter falsenii]
MSTKFLELNQSQDYTNITPAEALEIMQDHLATYNEGERFKRSYQPTRDALESIYGGKINKRKNTSTGANNNVTTNNKTSYIIKNDDVKEDEKFRYIRISQIRNILKKNISKSAHHLWTALQMSPNSNSLGAFEVTLRELQYQTISDSINDVVNDLNELQQQGELYYFNDVVYLTHFHSNQKQHGNDKAIKGILNNYNQLKDNQKLPFIGDFDTKNMTMPQLEEAFFNLKKAIELMGKLYSGADIYKSEMLEIWTSEQVDIIISGILTFEASQPVEKVSLVSAPVIENVNEEPQQETTPIIQEEPQQEEIIQEQQPAPPKKLSEEEIEKIIYDVCDIKEDKKEVFKKVLKHELFNNLFLYVRNGGINPTKIKELFSTSLFEFQNQGHTINQKSA